MTTLAQQSLRLSALLNAGRTRGCSRNPVSHIITTRHYGAVAASSPPSVSSYDDLGSLGLHHGPPPNHPAAVAQLTTFNLPTVVTGTPSNVALGKAMVEAWRKDGIFQISMDRTQRAVLNEAFKRSKEFFKLPHRIKSRHVDSQSFAGYIASGEELTDGVADYSEIFTITKDLPESDPRVKARWPCHGPCPWPSAAYGGVMTSLMEHIGDSGEKLLKLVALGLELEDPSSLSDLTEDGWHHMRVLRFPALDRVNGKGKAGRGIGSHTDYGLLVIAAQDHVGGLFVRPPQEDEEIKNWEKSAAGLNENDDKWHYVPPVDGVFTVFPGDMMQYMTNSYLPSTPHKVGLNTRERFAFAYFHEPNFSSVIKPLKKFADQAGLQEKGIHYGTHFTNMFMRNYPERITARRMMEEGRMDILKQLEQQSASD